jgi:hypothetical protein
MVSFLRLVLLISCSLSLAWSLSVAELAILELSVSENSCEFYNRLEWMVPCGEGGYVNNFAHKYCEAYLAARDDFNDTKWQNGARVCLQRAMLSKLRVSTTVSCSQISDWGFDSHFGCYMRPIPASPEIRFCRLKGQDIRRIGWIAKGEVFEGRVVKQFARMVKECAGQYLQDVKQDFVQFLKKTMNELGWQW